MNKEGLDPDIMVSQLAIATGLAVLLILLLIWRYICWHIARVYVYNEERRIHDVVSRQYVRVRTPKLRLSALQGMRKPSTRLSCADGSPNGWLVGISPSRPAAKASTMWWSRLWAAIMHFRCRYDKSRPKAA